MSFLPYPSLVPTSWAGTIRLPLKCLWDPSPSYLGPCSSQPSLLSPCFNPASPHSPSLSHPTKLILHALCFIFKHRADITYLFETLSGIPCLQDSSLHSLVWNVRSTVTQLFPGAPICPSIILWWKGSKSMDPSILSQLYPLSTLCIFAYVIYPASNALSLTDLRDQLLCFLIIRL